MSAKIKKFIIFPKGINEDVEKSKGIGCQVKLFREQHGWSQKQLARKARIGRGVIRRLEDGDVFIDIIDLFAVCNVLGIVPSDLLPK